MNIAIVLRQDLGSQPGLLIHDNMSISKYYLTIEAVVRHQEQAAAPALPLSSAAYPGSSDPGPPGAGPGK